MTRLDKDKASLNPIQEKLWERLKDGKPIPFKDLLQAGWSDTTVGVDVLRNQISLLRTKIRLQNQNETVICTNGCYQRVKFVKEMP